MNETTGECTACEWFAAVIEQTSGEARERVLRAWDRHMIEDAPAAAAPKEKSA